MGLDDATGNAWATRRAPKPHTQTPRTGEQVENGVIVWRPCNAWSVRTCLENAGFELLIAREGRVELEWYPDEHQIERRWTHLNRELRRDGWGELYAATK